jgi:hypothetical protein
MPNWMFLQELLEDELLGGYFPAFGYDSDGIIAAKWKNLNRTVHNIFDIK